MARRLTFGIVVALALGAAFWGGRLSARVDLPSEDVTHLSVRAADNPGGAVRASTRRLAVEFPLGDGCGDAPGFRVRFRDTPTAVRVVATKDPEPPGTSGWACAEAVRMARRELRLRRPLGTRRVVSVAGRVSVQRVDEDARRYVWARAPRVSGAVVSLTPGHRLRVVLRTDRALPPGLRLQLDESRALAPLRVLDARRRCYVATVPADGDPERAPHLLDSRPGHHPQVALLRRNGRYVFAARGEVAGRRTAAARITGARELGGLGCDLAR